MLREFYPAALTAFGEDLAGRDALAVLPLASTPAAGRALSRSRIAGALRRAGRQRNIDARAVSIVEALRSEQLGLSDALSAAYGASVRSTVAVITTMVEQIAVLETEVNRCFGQHPDAEIITSQPGLGVVLGARVLAEFGDDRDRFTDAKARRNYAGTSPITKASGTRRVVLARFARNRRLADALHQQAFAALNASPGARRYYDSPARPRSDSSPSPARPLEPARRHPRWLPTTPNLLRRSHRLGTPSTRSSLTTWRPGISRGARGPP